MRTLSRRVSSGSARRTPRLNLSLQAMARFLKKQGLFLAYRQILDHSIEFSKWNQPEVLRNTHAQLFVELHRARKFYSGVVAQLGEHAFRDGLIGGYQRDSLERFARPQRTVAAPEREVR